MRESTASAASSPLSEKSPTQAGMEFVPSDDEQTVNAALFLFLYAIILHLDIPSEWILYRREYIFGDIKKLFKITIHSYLPRYRYAKTTTYGYYVGQAMHKRRQT